MVKQYQLVLQLRNSPTTVMITGLNAIKSADDEKANHFICFLTNLGYRAQADLINLQVS